MSKKIKKPNKNYRREKYKVFSGTKEDRIKKFDELNKRSEFNRYVDKNIIRENERRINRFFKKNY